MKRKHQFLRAVQILAPNDPFTLGAAQRVSEETLPVAPGGAALEFVVAMERLKMSIKFNGAFCGNPAASERRAKPEADRLQAFDDTEASEGQLQLKDALCVKSAEYWLKLGQPAQALAVMETLPESVRKNAWVVKVRLAAVGAARAQHEFPIHVE
jgi:hypothetical protein